MIRFLEFLGNHPILTGLWLVLCGALLAYLKSKSARSVSPQQATFLVNREDGVIVDVRERKEYEKGHIVDAVNIPVAKLNERSVELDKHKNLPVIVVDQMGQNAGAAVKTLEARGFTQVSRMSGGMSEWSAQSLPLVK